MNLFSFISSSLVTLVVAISINLLVVPCAGFSSECIIPSGTHRSTSITSWAVSSSASAENGAAGSSSPDSKSTEPKISYRSAKPSDLSAIAGLLKSVFEDDNETAEGQGGSNDSSSGDNKTFLWGSLIEKKEEPQLSPEQQMELIEGQLAKRMIDAKKEDSPPHSFLIATIPSSDPNNDQQKEDKLIGFLEMGTLPSPIAISGAGNVELPYIGNVAVANNARRRKVGSTLVRLATKIASKWCVPSSETSSFPPFLFLSVERDNDDALKFYERLGFEELRVGTGAKSKSAEKIYLAQLLG